jgi:hypothetical protein
MRNVLALALLAGAAALSSGCLVKDTTHTLYLSPDGAVRWVVVESDVRSDMEEPAERLAEDQRYLGAALVGTHPIALGLQTLRPEIPVATTVIRDQRPFHVVTTAGFTRADVMFERLMDACGVKARASLSSDGDRSTLTIRFDFSGGEPGRESPAMVLLEALQDYRFVITEGTFIGGGGFDVPARGGHAKISSDWLSAAEEAMDAGRGIDLVLSWTAGV